MMSSCHACVTPHDSIIPLLRRTPASLQLDCTLVLWECVIGGCRICSHNRQENKLPVAAEDEGGGRLRRDIASL